MTIQFIASVTGNEFGMGNASKLLHQLPGDMDFFKRMTTNDISHHNPNPSQVPRSKNVVVMGHTTWKSLPKQPLPGRTNIVITRDSFRGMYSMLFEETYFLTFQEFKKIYDAWKPNVFVIGGGEIFRLFMRSKAFRPEYVYLTHIQDDNTTNADTFFPKKLLQSMYCPVYESEMFEEGNVTYQINKYKLSAPNS
jgi:dihydrofolate reductase